MLSTLRRHNAVLRAQVRDSNGRSAALLKILTRLEHRLDPHEGVIVNAIRKELRQG